MSQATDLIEQRVLRYLKTAEKIWLYEGPPDPRYPHALLTRGLHSNGYVDVGNLLKDYNQTRENIARFVLEALQEKYQMPFTAVVGAANYSNLLTRDIAHFSNTYHIKMMKMATSKRQVWSPVNRPLTNDDLILQAEDLIITAKSALDVRSAIRAQHPGINLKFAPFLPVVVDRSNPDNRITMIEESAVLPLLRIDIKTFDLATCPYCAVGSEPIEPHEGDNWYRLKREI